MSSLSLLPAIAIARMKRAFSMTELQAAILPKEEPLPEPILWTSTLRRSKSFSSFHFKFPVVSKDFEETANTISEHDSKPAYESLPSISSLGLSFQENTNRGFHVHGFEELKRCRGTSGMNRSSPFQLSSQSEANSTGYCVNDHDEETRGAASALMELFKQNAPNNLACSQTAANVLAPSLKLVSTSVAALCSSPSGLKRMFAFKNSG